MAEEVYYLNRFDREKLKALWADFTTRKPESKGHTKSELPQAPDVYIARSPTGGVPALDQVGTGTSTDDSPGRADCFIYQLIHPPGTSADPYLQQVGQVAKTVYNIGNGAVEGSSWFLVIRDKFGRWIATNTGGSGDEVGRWVYVTSNADTAGVWPARLLEKDNAGGRTLGDEVRVTLLPFAGSCFVVGDHWVTRNGSSGGYALYDGRGNDGWVHSVCRNGAAVCDKLYVPHPIRLVTDVDCLTGTGSGTA